MAEYKDPEKVPLLGADRSIDKEVKRSRFRCGPGDWRVFKLLAFVFIFHVLYNVVMRTLIFFLAPTQNDGHQHEGVDWARKAIWKQRGPLTPEKVEELYLYVSFLSYNLCKYFKLHEYRMFANAARSLTLGPRWPSLASTRRTPTSQALSMI